MSKKDWVVEYRGEGTTHFKNKKTIERIYLYNPTWFRGHEKEFVVSTNIYFNRQNIPFKTKSQAMAFINSYMAKH